MKKPLISFGIPSIRHIDYVRKTINMIFDKADDPSCIEIVFRFNTDSGPVTEYKNQQGYIDDILSEQPQERKDSIKFLFGESKYGYCSIGDFHHEIVEEYTGEFLFFFNDDCDDLTEGYDSVVKPYSGKCVILNIDNHHNPYDLFIMSRKFIELNNNMVQYSTYYNYDMFDWSMSFPEICHRVAIEVQHQPSAQFGIRISHGHDCRMLKDNDYTWNCKHFGVDGKHKEFRDDENGLNKRTKLLFVDIPNIKKQLKENPEYIYDIENNNPDDWEERELSVPDGNRCECCSFELQDIQEQVRDYLI